MVKIPKVNNHERMKILGILNKEFKSNDIKHHGYLEFSEFNMMKDFIIKFFIVFNHYKMMDETEDGKVSQEKFVFHSKDLELPNPYINFTNKVLFKKIDKKELGYIILVDWINFYNDNDYFKKQTQNTIYD